MKFSINRKKWLRGGRNNKGEGCLPYGLYKPEEKAGCCLGHVTRQYLHCSWKELKGMFPSTMLRKNNPFLAFEYIAANINDMVHMEEKDREKQLIDLFAENGHELRFYG